MKSTIALFSSARRQGNTGGSWTGPRVALWVIVALALCACSTCKSTDSPDICRTKQREHSQPRI